MYKNTNTIHILLTNIHNYGKFVLRGVRTPKGQKGLTLDIRYGSIVVKFCLKSGQFVMVGEKFMVALRGFGLILEGSILKVSEIGKIGELTLGDRNYTDLQHFFQKCWASPCKYVAVFARRCFALQSLFAQNKSVDSQLFSSKVTSDNGLLLHADEIAIYYDAWDVFPSILLVDDLLIYGRSISRFLYNFEELIVEKLKELKGITDFSASERYYIHRNLVRAVTIKVFAANKSPCLIRYLDEWEIIVQNRCYTNKLKELSQRISAFIQEVNEPNTSFRFSLLVPHTDTFDPEIEAQWQKETWSYRGEKRNVFFSPFCTEGFIPMVYTHGEGCLNSNNSVWITGLAVGGDITKAGFEDICEQAAKTLQSCEKNRYQWMVATLTEKRLQLQTQRTQLVSFMLSVVGVRDFCDSITIKQTQEQINISDANLQHIAMNFGLADSRYAEFSEFVGDDDLILALRKDLYKTFSEKVEPLFPNEYRFTSERLIEDCRHANELIEDVFYDVGTAGEFEANQLGNNLIPFNPRMSGSDTISLTDYVKRINNYHTIRPQLTNKQILVGLTAVTDSGLAALNFKLVDDCIKCMLKAGELSTFSLPRRLHWFIPALSKVEDARYALGTKPQELLERFIDYLATVGPQEFNGETASQAEIEAFSILIQKGYDFVMTIYQCGRTIGSWDTDLQTIGDWRQEEWEDSSVFYARFLYRNSIRRRSYINQANLFIEQFKHFID